MLTQLCMLDCGWLGTACVAGMRHQASVWYAQGVRWSVWNFDWVVPLNRINGTDIILCPPISHSISLSHSCASGFRVLWRWDVRHIRYPVQRIHITFESAGIIVVAVAAVDGVWLWSYCTAIVWLAQEVLKHRHHPKHWKLGHPNPWSTAQG